MLKYSGVARRQKVGGGTNFFSRKSEKQKKKKKRSQRHKSARYRVSWIRGRAYIIMDFFIKQSCYV